MISKLDFALKVLVGADDLDDKGAGEGGGECYALGGGGYSGGVFQQEFAVFVLGVDIQEKVGFIGEKERVVRLSHLGYVDWSARTFMNGAFFSDWRPEE